MDFAAEFTRWYIGAFSVFFGIRTLWRGADTFRAGCYFKAEKRDRTLGERFAAVVARREELEGDATPAARMLGVAAVAIGVLVLIQTIVPLVAYALLCVVLAVTMSYVYSQMRNRSERRAASLQPRTATTTVPGIWYAGGILAALLPLAFAIVPSLVQTQPVVPAVIIALACTAIVYTAARLSQMAALLAGDDPEIELYVDDRLRRMRVSSLLMLAYAVSFVFIVFELAPEHRLTGASLAVGASSFVLLAAFSAWLAVKFFFGRMSDKLPA